MPAPASTLTAFDAMMKELYEGTDPQDVAMKKHVFFTHVTKKGGFVGDVMPTPIGYGHPQGRSRTFSTAQSGASASSLTRFMITRIKDYGVVTIDSELMLASKGDLGAFAEARKYEVDAMLAEVGDSISRSIVRDQKGMIGTISVVTAATNGVITLTDKSEARHFSKGQVFGAVLTPYGTPTVRTGTGTVTVVDRTLGKITFSGTITSITAGDLLFTAGDYSSASPAQSFAGLQAWFPLVAPTTGDSFFGVDRSVDTRLSGQRIDNASAPIHENIMLLAEEIQAAGGSPDKAYINHQKMTELIWELGSKVQYVGGEDKVKALFRGVMVPYSGGWIEVYGEPEVQRTLGYVLDMSTIELRYLGSGLPHLVDDDGNMAVRSSDADGIEVRGRYYGNLRCLAPARNGVFSISN